MKKKHSVIVFLLILVLGLTLIALLWPLTQLNKTDYEIRSMFECDRVTTEILATDVYCRDPNLYRHHLKEYNVIKPNDFNRL